jgi:hypothetical protein
LATLEDDIRCVSDYASFYKNVQVVCPEVEQQLLCRHFERVLKATFTLAEGYVKLL